jgi:hypothetical protein
VKSVVVYSEAKAKRLRLGGSFALLIQTMTTTMRIRSRVVLLCPADPWRSAIGQRGGQGCSGLAWQGFL